MVEVIYLNFVSNFNDYVSVKNYVAFGFRQIFVWCELYYFFNLRIFLYYENNTCPLGGKIGSTNKQEEKDEKKSLTAKPSLTLRHFTLQVLF